MSLVSRVSLTGPETEEPEDFFSSSLGVIFPDYVANSHGDADHDVVYTSPNLPKPLHLSLADPTAAEDRDLFSHYVWNAGLVLAELIEAGTLGLSPSKSGTGAAGGDVEGLRGTASDFSVAGLSTFEVGAGTGLPSLMAALLGASRVVITDYPSPVVLENLHDNVRRNAQSSFSPLGSVAPVVVEGHEWGRTSTPLAEGNRHAFDRVLSCDCLWMPWQHGKLRESLSWFLADLPAARVWIVAGFHTGREKMRGFFDGDALAAVGLEVERIWERDCNGEERPWAWDRGIEDVSLRKRWAVLAILRRTGRSVENPAS